MKNQLLVDDRVTYGEDFLCVCFCLLDAKSVMTLQQSGYHYIQRATSATHQIAASSNRDPLPIKVWRQVLKNLLEQKNASKKLCEICSHIGLSVIMNYCNRDYDLLLQNFPDCPLPFPNVNVGARIVVYGAGKVGCSLIRSLDKTKNCSVVLWVDQNQGLPAVPGYTISTRNAIFSADYDFIVVAILNAAVAGDVKRSLILDGIPEDKIAAMDAIAVS